jgi:hypothetical protein
VEWSKAKARKTRWEEEVELLREEMRRVLRYLTWETETWEARAAATAARVDIAEDARSGLRGYALAQAACFLELATHLRTGWSVSVDEATSSVVGESGDGDLADLTSLFAQSS